MLQPVDVMMRRRLRSGWNQGTRRSLSAASRPSRSARSLSSSPAASFPRPRQFDKLTGIQRFSSSQSPSLPGPAVLALSPCARCGLLSRLLALL
eukprot:3939162-Rhodomonas_salina.3